MLIHLGTNDVGQMGAAGVPNADANLRSIIDQIRSVEPAVTILLGQIIPIGPGTSYYVNADQVDSLNLAIAAIAADKDLPDSPVILVDHNTGFDLDTMMQPDGLHPNLAGEAFMAGVWLASLAPLLPPGNPPPQVEITAPEEGAIFVDPPNILIEADASDPNGTVTEVSFYAGPLLLGVDDSSPYSIDWFDPEIGSYALSAVAEDDEGATRRSDPVWISVLPPPGDPVQILNPSFENPPLGDGALAEGPGVVGDWLFSGTANTFVGIFNPPEGSYPGAGGSGTPVGSDGAQVAYLFNNGSAADSVSAVQELSEVLLPDTEYVLSVAIGRFLPDQPYAFSTYGGYVIELLAGSQRIASDSGSVEPPTGEFRDAFAFVSSADLDPGLLGETLSIRLDISGTDPPQSTHFDNVRLTRRDLSTAAVEESPASRLSLAVSPNPMRQATTISYTLDERGSVSLSVYDVTGRLVEILVDGEIHEPGIHILEYVGPEGTGVWFVRLQTSRGAERSKLIRLD